MPGLSHRPRLAGRETAFCGGSLLRSADCRSDFTSVLDQTATTFSFLQASSNMILYVDMFLYIKYIHKVLFKKGIHKVEKELWQIYYRYKNKIDNLI